MMPKTNCVTQDGEAVTMFRVGCGWLRQCLRSCRLPVDRTGKASGTLALTKLVADFMESESMGEQNLRQLIARIADDPTINNRDNFYNAFLTSKIGARLPDEYRSVQNGDTYSTIETDRIGVPTTNGPDGSPMLLVYCDIPSMIQKFPNDRFFELDGIVVLEMARKANHGIIVQNLVDDTPSWAGIPSEDVAKIFNAQ